MGFFLGGGVEGVGVFGEFFFLVKLIEMATRCYFLGLFTMLNVVLGYTITVMGTRYTCLTWPITSMCLYRDGSREIRDPRCLYCIMQTLCILNIHTCVRCAREVRESYL